MSTEKFPLVWWVKKHLPHRHGQRCRRTHSRHGEIALRPLAPEPWEAADPEWRLFEFEDGTREWGPKHCARRPEREWRDTLEHRTPECTGEWGTQRGGIHCSRCGVWVRRTPENEEAKDAERRTDYMIQRMVRTNKWRAVIEAAVEGTDPLDFIRLLVKADRGLNYNTAFVDAAGEFNILVGGKAREARDEHG